MSFIPIAFFDPPEVFNAAVTPIPALADPPIQVISDSGISIGSAIFFSDTTNAIIGVYTGPVGKEILACIIGGGISSLSYGVFPSHSRVSLRSLVNTAITSGLLTANLVTS